MSNVPIYTVLLHYPFAICQTRDIHDNMHNELLHELNLNILLINFPKLSLNLSLVNIKTNMTYVMVIYFLCFKLFDHFGNGIPELPPD